LDVSTRWTQGRDRRAEWDALASSQGKKITDARQKDNIQLRGEIGERLSEEKRDLAGDQRKKTSIEMGVKTRRESGERTRRRRSSVFKGESRERQPSDQTSSTTWETKKEQPKKLTSSVKTPPLQHKKKREEE